MRTNRQDNPALFELQESAIITSNSKGQHFVSSIGPSGRKLFAPAYCNPFRPPVLSPSQHSGHLAHQIDHQSLRRPPLHPSVGYSPSSRGFSGINYRNSAIAIEEFSPTERLLEPHPSFAHLATDWEDPSFLSFDNFKEGVFPLLMDLPDAHVAEEFLRVGQNY